MNVVEALIQTVSLPIVQRLYVNRRAPVKLPSGVMHNMQMSCGV